jgi:NADPH:quinone reductase-like Zn-dependent oxidoreductase
LVERLERGSYSEGYRLDRWNSTSFFALPVDKLTRLSRFKEMVRLIIANPEKTKPIIDKVFSFDQVLEAFAHLESQRHVGKIVIKIV